MNLTYTVPGSVTPKRGYTIKTYPCGHRFLVCESDGGTRIIDLAQVVGTKQLRIKS